MSYSKIILQDSAEIIWPLDDISPTASISKPINFYTQNPYSFSASINTDFTDVVENPIVFGGGQSLRFISSSVGMSIPAMSKLSEIYKNKNSCISFWYQTEYLSTTEVPIFKKRNFDNIGLFIKDNYLIFRYGTSASYSEVYGPLSNPEDPNHIVIGRSPSALSIIINGVLYSNRIDSNYELSYDPNFTDNDYIDFYGPPQESWIIDSVAMYPNILSGLDAKRHYVYGLGKYFGDDIFSSRGGTIYNFSSIDTEKIFRMNLKYPQEWRNAEINNLLIDNDGIKPIKYDDPIFYSYNQDILTSSNQISFRTTSGSPVNAAYIDISNLYQKIGSGDYPFFVKVKFDGTLPNEFEKQRIISFGQYPDYEVLTFNLYNQSGSYKLLIETENGYSTEFNIENIQSQPEAYIGMRFLQNSEFYFVQSGSSVQSSSFNFYNNGYGLDPLSIYFPPDVGKLIRIGSSISYQNSTYSEDMPSVNQFSGTFKNFVVLQNNFSSSVNYSYIDSFRKNKYKLEFNSNKNRFNTFSYGDLTFNIHAIDMGKFINDTEQVISANIINFGYPDILSSSQVLVYATHYEYSGSVIYPRTVINNMTTIPFINNKNISGTYLKFDFEVYSEDSNYYPPIIDQFSMETYGGTPEKVTLRHDDGSSYYLYNSSSNVFLPEIKQTPNIFMNKNSGIKMNNSISEFTESFSAKPLDPRTISGLRLWLDSRFLNGLNKINLDDDKKVNIWTDLSDNGNHAIQLDSASAPVFRIQSLNILTNNQGNGGEDGTIENIIAINSSASPSPDGAISGYRGFELTPNNSSVNSYLELGRNTASMTILPNQSYSVVGSIKLTKPQTASYLHQNARSIQLYVDSGSGLTLTASSNSASNIAGVYNLYSEFTTPSVVFDASIRFYNGSYSDLDSVYWDSIAIYPKQSGSYVESWVRPLTSDSDMPIIKFNGSSFMQSSASSTQPYTLYVVGRIFNDGSLIGYSASGASIYSQDGLIEISSENSIVTASSDNSFHIYTLKVSSGYSKFYIDNAGINFDYLGASNLNNILLGIGDGGSLTGDLSAILLFSGSHSDETINIINKWLDESFNVPQDVASNYSTLASSTRGIFGGGFFVNTMDYITIETTGNATDFGDLTVTRFGLGACSSYTRGIFGGGRDGSGTLFNIMDYVTISTIGNATDFGDLTVAREYLAACSSLTRGIFGGGNSPAANTIDYITISTIGNATDFGDLISSTISLSSCSSPTRGVFAGGQTTAISNRIEYITIATTGNSTDFGDLTSARQDLGSCASTTRGIFSGGTNFSTRFNTIDYITIATTGNATDFGDLTVAREGLAGCSSQVRGVFAGGFGGTNTIDYVNISTIGNATDFGELSVGRAYLAGLSSNHGGLQI